MLSSYKGREDEFKTETNEAIKMTKIIKSEIEPYILIKQILTQYTFLTIEDLQYEINKLQKHYKVTKKLLVRNVHNYIKTKKAYNIFGIRYTKIKDPRYKKCYITLVWLK